MRGHGLRHSGGVRQADVQIVRDMPRRFAPAGKSQAAKLPTGPISGGKITSNAALDATCDANANRPAVQCQRGLIPACATGSTGRPSDFQAENPPPTCATGASPISCAAFVASADRQPLAQ